MKALKCRIKAWKVWIKHYYGLTWLYAILVFLGIIYSPTFDLEYRMTIYKEGDHETYEGIKM